MKTELHALLNELRTLRAQVCAEGDHTFDRWRPAIKRRSFLISGQNLAHYLALRQRDLRPLQAALTPFGLSSLGRSEARVITNLDAVIASLSAICGDAPSSIRWPRSGAFYRGQRLLAGNAAAVLGGVPGSRRVRIMVTMPTEAADDYGLVFELLRSGMNCARINCAHDTQAVWELMIRHIRRAEAETGLRCKVIMDLGGPKARTGNVLTPPDDERLRVDDYFLLTPGTPIPTDEVRFQAECQIPEALTQVKLGEAVWFDDGKVGAQVVSIEPRGVMLRVTHVREKGVKLRPAKGLNFPDTDLNITPLTAKDRQDVAFAATHADGIGYSFVQTAADIALLQDALASLVNDPRRMPAIIAKIETRKAIVNLPEIIVQAASQQHFGVMIARGDLAVEIGYQRLAEMQEELLWICEAAHVPVIWATQVLENLVKEGTPSRAEMTDAAMAERAECVMLNKGPFIIKAVRILDEVLTRMGDHQIKKTPQLRALRTWKTGPLVER
jgi:pyruvate kinase